MSLFRHTAEKLPAPVRTVASLLFPLLLLSWDQSNTNGHEGSLSRRAQLIGCCDRSLLCLNQLPHLGFPQLDKVLSLPLWCGFHFSTLVTLQSTPHFCPYHSVSIEITSNACKIHEYSSQGSHHVTEQELWQTPGFLGCRKFGNYIAEWHHRALLGNKCYPYSDSI